jgi:DNA modification methylase
MGTRKKKQPVKPETWRNRIVGHGVERAEDLLANPKNWRIHPGEQQEALAKVLDKVGWVQEVILNQRTGFVLDGHLRAAMAITRGEQVPVAYVDLDPTEEDLILATFDQITGMAVPDAEKLSELMAGVETEFPDLAEMLASLDAESEPEAEQVPAAGLTGDDETPEPPEAPVTVPGDLWHLGPHRVLCGDSTSSEAVSRLLGATVPFLMVTDPPYGVEYDPEWRDGKGGFSTAPVKQRGKVTNDDRAGWHEAYALFPGSVAYVWHASLKTAEVVISLVAAAFDVRAMIIWAKQQAVFSRGAYHWQHEPCWYAVRKGRTANWKGDRTQSTIWQVQNLNPTGNRTEERVGHGTQKPIELMRRPILNHTATGDAVYDPFLGSGSTLIACEKEGRICYGIDIDPKYVDVIVRRWQDFTGKQATLDGDGRTFDEIAAERTGVVSAGRTAGRERTQAVA